MSEKKVMTGWQYEGGKENDVFVTSDNNDINKIKMFFCLTD